MSQRAKLLAVLADHRWHSTVDLLHSVYGGSHLGLARLAARVHDLRRAGHEIEGRRDEENPTIYHYRLVEKEPATVPLTFGV